MVWRKSPSSKQVVRWRVWCVRVRVTMSRPGIERSVAWRESRVITVRALAPRGVDDEVLVISRVRDEMLSSCNVNVLVNAMII